MTTSQHADTGMSVTNALVSLMQEFGVEVRMLGADESPDPASDAICAMLTEIHTLRHLQTPLLARPVSDEELARVLWASKQSRTADRGRYDSSSDTPFERLHQFVVDDLLDDVRAVVAAIGPQKAAIPDGWKLIEVLWDLWDEDPDSSGGSSYRVWLLPNEIGTHPRFGYGPTPEAAMVHATAQIGGE